MDSSSNQVPLSEEEIARLIAELGSSNPATRLQSRNVIVEAGPQILPHVEALLSHDIPRFRLEAAKVLQAIGDPNSAPLLVKCLMDETMEIQWVAAEALVGLGSAGLGPLLQALTTQFRSVPLRHGTHHILHSLEFERRSNADLQSLYDTLKELAPLESVAVAAERALRSLDAALSSLK